MYVQDFAYEAPEAGDIESTSVSVEEALMDKILLVLPPLNAWAADFTRPDLGYAHGLISFLVEISNLTVFVPSDVDIRKYDDYLKRDLGSHARAISLAEINRLGTQPRDTLLVDYKPFVDQSSQIYEYISQSDFDCVIFDVFEATGFIPIRSKRTGLGLGKTVLVSWLRTCHEFQRRQVLETSQYHNNFTADQELDFAERYCCQYCDLILTHTDTILKWVVEQEWNIDRGKVLPLAGLRTGRSLQLVAKKFTADDANQPQDQSQPQKTNPLLSICIAHFNDGRNLRYLLKSIEENDYKNFEVIVVDDASTDAESQKIFESLASEYATDSWRFMRKEKNESVGPTRNFAVNHARGEFIFFLDSDDLAAKTLFSDFVRGMAHSGADCLTCPLVFFEGDGGTPAHRSFIKFWMPLGACLEVGIYDNAFGGANFCIKKSVFEALGGFCSPRGENHEEWEFLARLVLAGFDMDVLPKALYFYRVRSGSRSQTARSNASVQKLRHRILSSSGPQHVKIIRDLLLRTMGENDRLRASAWKLDRKIVRIALKIIDVISEKNRLIVENISTRIYKKLKAVWSSVSRFLRAMNVMHRLVGNANEDILNFVDYKIDNSRFFVRTLSDSQLVEKLKRLGLPLLRPIFGLVGEMNQEKSVFGFLRLAYWMQMSRDDSFFVLLGNGAFENEMRTTATKYNLRNYKWFPFLEKPEELYAILSGFVITSNITPPVEMFEALACGVPVFSTDVGEAKRLLGKYGSGVVVSHDPQHKDFADCFKLWKSNLEIYKTAAMETAELIQRNSGV